MRLIVTALYAAALLAQSSLLCLFGWESLVLIVGARPSGLIAAVALVLIAAPIVLASRRKLASAALLPARMFNEDPLHVWGSTALTVIAFWFVVKTFDDRGSFAKEALIGNWVIAVIVLFLSTSVMEYRIRRLERSGR